jgi:hypothetical protein
LLILLSTAVVAPAQEDYSLCDQTITNQNQLGGVFNCDTFCMPIDPPAFQEWLLDPQFLWADFASLPAEFGAAFAQSQDQVQGVSVLKLRLTRFLLTGETLVQFPVSTNTLTLAARVSSKPSGFGDSVGPSRVARVD